MLTILGEFWGLAGVGNSLTRLMVVIGSENDGGLGSESGSLLNMNICRLFIFIY